MTDAEAKISPIIANFPPEQIRPMEDYVVVRHLPPPTMTEGSLHIPETAQQGATYTFGQGFLFRGTVISVGPGSRYLDQLKDDGTGRGNKKWVKKLLPERSPMSTQPGDVVLFERRRESEVSFEGQIYSFLREEQSVVAVEEPAA